MSNSPAGTPGPQSNTILPRVIGAPSRVTLPLTSAVFGGSTFLPQPTRIRKRGMIDTNFQRLMGEFRVGEEKTKRDGRTVRRAPVWLTCGRGDHWSGTTSPRSREPRAWRTTSVVESRMNRTDPSPISMFAPPLWTEVNGKLLPELKLVPLAALAPNPRWLIVQRMVVMLNCRSPFTAPTPPPPAPMTQPWGPWLVTGQPLLKIGWLAVSRRKSLCSPARIVLLVPSVIWVILIWQLVHRMPDPPLIGPVPSQQPMFVFTG